MALTIEDRLEITDLYARYCHELDLGVPAGWAATFAPNGTFQRVEGDKVLVEVTGHDDLAAFVLKVHQAEQGSVRRWANTVILGSEHAGKVVGQSYLTMVKAVADEVRPEGASSLYSGSVPIVATSLTRDELVRTPDGWRFALRQVSVDQ